LFGRYSLSLGRKEPSGRGSLFVLSERFKCPLSFEAYGINGNIGTLAGSTAEAEAAAMIIGGPVAVKVQSADIAHKTEVGGVALNVAPTDARAAYERVLENAKQFVPTAEIEGVLVQPMIPAGREVIVGISRDEFGARCSCLASEVSWSRQ
jgi:acetate---CoA ligase (ADP-forming)